MSVVLYGLHILYDYRKKYLISLKILLSLFSIETTFSQFLAVFTMLIIGQFVFVSVCTIAYKPLQICHLGCVCVSLSLSGYPGELLEEHQRVLWSRLATVNRDITDSRFKIHEDLESHYRKIVGYMLLRSGVGSPTDVNTVRETTGKQPVNSAAHTPFYEQRYVIKNTQFTVFT